MNILKRQKFIFNISITFLSLAAPYTDRTPSEYPAVIKIASNLYFFYT
jgi:hypothetical protein